MSSHSSSRGGSTDWNDVKNVVTSLYPDLLNRTYAVPPAHFNKVPYARRDVPGTGLSALVLDSPSGDAAPEHDAPPTSPPALPPIPESAWTQGTETPVRVQESDFRNDFAQNHVVCNLQELGKSQKDVMVILSPFNFGSYLNQSAYAATVAQFPVPHQLNTKTIQYSDGEADFMILHRQHGILVGELKSIGKPQAKNTVTTDADIAKRVRQAVKQVERSAEVVRHLVNDIAPGLAVRKTLFLPYVSSKQLERVLLADPSLEQETCTSLGAVNAEEAALLSCCSDHLSNPATYWDVTEDVLFELKRWWTHRMACIVNTQLSDQTYIDIVARFVGPASTVNVQCNFSPRVEVRTKGQLVAELGWRLAHLILTLEQLDLMNRDPNLVCITGPPGTGKTIVLILQGLRWRLQGHDVHVVSTRPTSRAVSTLIQNQIKITATRNTTSSLQQPGKVVLHHYDFMNCEGDVTKAVTELSAVKESDGSLHVILDEAVFDISTKQGPLHKDMVTELVNTVPKLHLWSACVLKEGIPEQLQEEIFTTPLRCAPVVLRELQPAISRFNVYDYSDMGIPSHGDGPNVIRLYHQGKGHVGQWPVECPQCGCDVAAELRLLGVGTTGTSLKYRDVFVLTRSSQLQDSVRNNDKYVVSPASGMVLGLRETGLPVHVLGRQIRAQDKAKWENEMGNVALAKADMIVVAHGGEVTGLERRIVVILQGWFRGGDDGKSDRDIDSSDRLLSFSRCTTQLIMVTVPAPAITTVTVKSTSASDYTRPKGQSSTLAALPSCFRQHQNNPGTIKDDVMDGSPAARPTAEILRARSMPCISTGLFTVPPPSQANPSNEKGKGKEKTKSKEKKK
ncbi:uncharacterized protein [Littorina saxatilis]|uniref:uncharacterized protein n=1 Tax=Littorina saxatilis TaxID=31220 RepID=UPI0038B6679F